MSGISQTGLVPVILLDIHLNDVSCFLYNKKRDGAGDARRQVFGKEEGTGSIPVRTVLIKYGQKTERNSQAESWRMKLLKSNEAHTAELFGGKMYVTEWRTGE